MFVPTQNPSTVEVVVHSGGSSDIAVDGVQLKTRDILGVWSPFYRPDL